MTEKELMEKLEAEEIATEDLLNEEFMSKFTQFRNYDELEEELASRCKSKTADKDKALRNVLLEKTSFKDLEAMKKKAIQFYLSKH